MATVDPPAQVGPAKLPAAGAANSPGAAVGAFEQTVVAAVGAAAAAPAGDPKVRASLRLGWLVDDLLDGRRPALLPGDLSPTEAAVGGALAQANQLTTLVAILEVDTSDAAPVIAAARTGSAQSAAATWEPVVVAALFGGDPRFAKAYVLGRQLSALANGGGPPDASQPPLVSMVAALDDLSSVLPQHAGRAVGNSMRRWVGATAVDAAVLHRQCELWRSLLVGEKRGTEMLEPENYLDAADRLGSKLHVTAIAVLRRLGWLVAVIAVLFGGGIAIVVADPGRLADAAAGLSGVIAAVGLTYKGIGGALGKLVAKLEAPLWEAEIDGAITDAITLAGTPPPATSIATRRKRAATGDYAGRADRTRGKLKP